MSEELTIKGMVLVGTIIVGKIVSIVGEILPRGKAGCHLLIALMWFTIAGLSISVTVDAFSEAHRGLGIILNITCLLALGVATLNISKASAYKHHK